jgi:hypothetical protein
MQMLSYLTIQLQSRKLTLQQLLQSSLVSTEMRNIKSLACPIFATFVVVATVQVYCVIECSGCDPFEFFGRVRLFGLFD